MRNLIIDVVWSLTPCLLGETKNKKVRLLFMEAAWLYLSQEVTGSAPSFSYKPSLDSLILLEVISTVCFIGPEKPLRGIGQSSKLSHLRADNSHILPF